MGVISIENLSFSYEDKQIFKNINLEIEENRWLTVLGSNGSGKSTLVSLILGLKEYEGKIEVNGMDVFKNKKIIRKMISAVLADPDSQIIHDTVDDELSFPLQNIGMSMPNINLKKEEIVNALGIKKLLQLKPSELSGGEKILVAIATALMTDSEIIILDEALEMLDNVEKNRVIKLLKKRLKQGATIINITQDIEDSLLGDDILLMDDGNVVLYDTKEAFYNNDEEIKKYGLSLPFIVDLSLKLQYYGLVQKIYFDMEELVNAIWK